MKITVHDELPSNLDILFTQLQTNKLGKSYNCLELNILRRIISSDLL